MEKIFIFRVSDKLFAVDINRVKRIVKESQLSISPIDGMPSHIIGVADIETGEERKSSVTLVDIRAFLRQSVGKIQGESGEQNLEGESSDELKDEGRSKKFLILASVREGKEGYVGLLIDDIIEIRDVEGKEIVEAPEPLKGIFIGMMDVRGEQGVKRIFILNSQLVDKLVWEMKI